MQSDIPPIIKTALLVILNHVEPGWENCVGLVSQWLDASNPTRQDATTAETSTQNWNEKAEHERDLEYESRQDYESDQLAGNPPEIEQGE